MSLRNENRQEITSSSSFSNGIRDRESVVNYNIKSCEQVSGVFPMDKP